MERKQMVVVAGITLLVVTAVLVGGTVPANVECGCFCRNPVASLSNATYDGYNCDCDCEDVVEQARAAVAEAEGHKVAAETAAADADAAVIAAAAAVVVAEAAIANVTAAELSPNLDAKIAAFRADFNGEMFDANSAASAAAAAKDEAAISLPLVEPAAASAEALAQLAADKGALADSAVADSPEAAGKSITTLSIICNRLIILI
jgi:hypothetical protein